MTTKKSIHERRGRIRDLQGFRILLADQLLNDKLSFKSIHLFITTIDIEVHTDSKYNNELGI